jgi:hypothetical protein
MKDQTPDYDYYTTPKGCERNFLLILVAFIVTVLVITSCEKPAEKYNFACDVMEIWQYTGAKCPDTVFSELYKKDITESQQMQWLATYPGQEKRWVNGDTVLITSLIIGCGKTICVK